MLLISFDIDYQQNNFDGGCLQLDGNLYGVASDFDVFYKPEKGGVYEISVFCGNIPLNHGRPFLKEDFEVSLKPLAKDGCFI